MRFLLLLSLVLGCWNLIAAGEEAVNADSTIITGARTWRMANGSTKRLRFECFTKHEGVAEFQSGGEASRPLKLKDFADEEQAVFAALKDGRLKLTSTPGLSLHANFPTGKNVLGLEHSELWLGETRKWENSQGKIVEARLISLTDEDVSLLIGDMVSRVPFRVLSPPDMDYIQELKAGRRRTYPDRVKMFGNRYEGGEPYAISISGEKYADLAERGSNFEVALEAAFLHVKSMLVAHKLDAKSLELGSFTEEMSWPPQEITSYFAIKAIPKDGIKPHIYEAEFYIKQSAVAKTRRIWPLQMTPLSWPGAPMLHIYVAADGSILDAKRND